LRETNPDSTNPDGFDYGARIIAEQTFMGLLAPYSNSEGICSTPGRETRRLQNFIVTGKLTKPPT